MTDPNLPDQPSSVPPASQPAPAYGQTAPAYGQPTGPKTNTLAIVALVSSIVGLGIFIGLIAGIICGHISLGQIKKTGEQGRGMAIAGLIIGYVGVALWIIGTIIFIAFLGLLATTNGFNTTY